MPAPKCARVSAWTPFYRCARVNATVMSLGSATFVLYNRCILGQEQRVPDFKVVSDFVPTGDQPEAIEALAEGVLRGDRYQTLLGVTGSGKTFTMAKVAEQVQRPTLVIAHNKTLAAQLATEFREFLPDNAVEYFGLLLRLLPARGIHPPHGHVHREGRLHQRRDRPLAARRHTGAADAPRRPHRRLRLLHLRPWATPRST